VSLFLWFKNPGFSLRRVEIVLSSTLLFFTLTIFQGLVSESELRGSIGGNFVDFLSPYIGVAGVWIFWLMSISLAGMILLDKSFHEVGEIIKKLTVYLPEMPQMKKQAEDEIPIVEKEVDANSKFDEEIIEEVFETPPMQEAIEDEEFIPEPPVLYPNKEDKPLDEMKSGETEDLIKEAEKSTIIAVAKKIKSVKKPEIVNEKKSSEESHAVIVNELEENKQLLDQIDKGTVEKPKDFKLPSVDFLQKPVATDATVNEEELDAKIQDLIEKLAHFKIDGDVVRTYAGPVVSTFEFKPVANVKVSKILNLQDDLAMALRAQTIRIQAPIPGKDVVGIEIPNKSVETIYLREIFESNLFKESSSPLTMVLGKDIVGKPFITDLKKLPHLLIAGTTGSGKSVGINSMILSLLYKNSPDNLKLLMIDPKMLEFSIYNDIPHLLTPVITKAKQAIVALNNMVAEMERRYGLMAETRK